MSFGLPWFMNFILSYLPLDHPKKDWENFIYFSALIQFIKIVLWKSINVFDNLRLKCKAWETRVVMPYYLLWECHPLSFEIIFTDERKNDWYEDKKYIQCGNDKLEKWNYITWRWISWLSFFIFFRKDFITEDAHVCFMRRSS